MRIESIQVPTGHPFGELLSFDRRDQSRIEHTAFDPLNYSVVGQKIDRLLSPFYLKDNNVVLAKEVYDVTIRKASYKVEERTASRGLDVVAKEVAYFSQHNGLKIGDKVLANQRFLYGMLEGVQVAVGLERYRRVLSTGVVEVFEERYFSLGDETREGIRLDVPSPFLSADRNKIAEAVGLFVPASSK